MDHIDKKIKDVLSKNLTEPIGFKQIIRQSLYKENKKTISRFNFVKIISTAIGSVVLLGGIVFAGYTITSEKVWKEPVKLKEEEESLSIISEDKIDDLILSKDLLSEEEAIQKGKEILKKLGYPEDIKYVKLYHNIYGKYNYYYNLSTNELESVNYGIVLHIDAKSGKLLSVSDYSKNLIGKNLDNISQEMAIKKAKEILNKVEISLEKYELKTSNEKDNIWELEFAKYYDDIVDDTNSIRISFGLKGEDVFIRFLRNEQFQDNENNEFIITEDEAKQIAINKEEELSDIEILDVKISKSVEQMNTFIYCLENNIDYSFDLISDDRIRNVWLVEIIHVGGKDNARKIAMGFDEIKKYADKLYYVDGETGEIIGGGIATDNYIDK